MVKEDVGTRKRKPPIRLRLQFENHDAAIPREARYAAKIEHSVKFNVGKKKLEKFLDLFHVVYSSAILHS